MSDAPWLFLIDLQPVFSAPDSPWHTPGMADLYARLAPLVTMFGERVLCSRFVPPEQPLGSWRGYYERWDFAHAAGPELWELDAEWRHLPAITSPRFGKWREARHILGQAREVVIAGVATDCCVLNTAMEAMDDGATLRVLSDGCLSESPAVQEAALAMLGQRAPQIVFDTIGGVLAAG